MKKILRNIIRCNHCGDVIESHSRHSYVRCSCGAVAVDGGTDYLRRSYAHSPEDYTDLTEYEEIAEPAAPALADAPTLHAFALKWLQKFEDEHTVPADLEENFGPDCTTMGFKMDLGLSFQEHYPVEAFTEAEEFAKIVSSIDDVMLLGSAIFSKWRILTHWWNDPLCATHNTEWFLLALDRLAALTE